MVVVMYGGFLFAVFVAVVFAATKGGALGERGSEFPTDSHHVAHSARPDKERVHNNV
jgi:hypothetical protein